MALILRRLSSAIIDRHVCFCFLSAQSVRSYAVGPFSSSSSSPNKDFEINPLFINRNPRNLEMMGLARKRQGWIFQSPRKDYYHRVVFERTNRHTTARIEHFSGRTVVTASTTEWAIRDGLYSCVDVSAAENIGRVLAQRGLECGITQVFCEYLDQHSESEKTQAFMNGMKNVGIELQEPEVLEPEFVHGIDYSRPNRIGEPKQWKDDYQPL